MKRKSNEYYLCHPCGGSGIGKAIAAMLPKEDTIIITGRNAGKLQKTADQLNAGGAHVQVAACDVSTREDVRKLAEYAASCGEVKKVFHCAGVSGSMADRETIIRIKALGTLYVNQEFYKVITSVSHRGRVFFHKAGVFGTGPCLFPQGRGFWHRAVPFSKLT